MRKNKHHNNEQLRAAQVNELRAAQRELRQLESSLIDARYSFARQNGMTHNGARDLWSVFGYADDIDAKLYRKRYDRGGLTGRLVDMRPDATWRGDGDVFENEDENSADTQFEKDWKELKTRLHIWSVCARADKLASIHRHSAILIGAPGNVDEPLSKGTPDDVIFLKPFDDQDMEVDTLDADVTSPRFGLPLTYLFKRNTSSNAAKKKQIVSTDLKALTVHYTRVIHIPAEGFLDDEVYGPPSLERVWNLFDDLDKVVGGGGEAGWMRANAITQVDIDKDIEYQSDAGAEEDLRALREKIDALKNQLTRIIVTRGVKMSQIGGEPYDFKNNAEILIQMIAGSKGIPQRILLGTEAGSLASDQDRNNWNDQITDRRTAYAGPYIARQLIDRFIEFGFLATPKQYEIEWPDVRSMTMMERLDAAGKAASLNDHGQLVTTNDEIRADYLDREPIDPTLADEFKNPPAEEAVTNQLAKAAQSGVPLTIVARK